MLRMGEAVRILELARNLIALSGLDPDAIPIEFTGLRPGEKLHEELHAESDAALPSPHPQIVMARLGTLPVNNVLHAVHELVLQARCGDEDRVRAGLAALIPDYDAGD